MYSSTKQFIDRLEADGTRYQYTEDATSGHHNMVTLCYGGQNIPSLFLKFLFDETCENVSIRASALTKFPEEKLTAMLAAVNGLNNRFRYIKFIVDTDDNTVYSEMDACFREHDVGEICNDILMRNVAACDRAYPELMKIVWG